MKHNIFFNISHHWRKAQNNIDVLSIAWHNRLVAMAKIWYVHYTFFEPWPSAVTLSLPLNRAMAKLKKKALAITHVFHKFDQLVFGKFDFPVQSDHKPLETCSFDVSRCRKSLTLFVRDLFTIQESLKIWDLTPDWDLTAEIWVN